MIKIFPKIFKLLFLFSTIVTSWTSVLIISNTSFNLEIKEVLAKMYLNQKNFVFNIKDLSVLLLKDANERIYGDNQDISHLNDHND